MTRNNSYLGLSQFVTKWDNVPGGFLAEFGVLMYICSASGSSSRLQSTKVSGSTYPTFIWPWLFDCCSDSSSSLTSVSMEWTKFWK